LTVWAQDQLAPGTSAPAGAIEAEPAPPKVLLTYKYQPGQTVRYEVQQESEMKTRLGGASSDDRYRSEVRRSYRVLQKTNDEADLELLIDWARMTVDHDDQVNAPKHVVFQSDDPSKHPALFRPVLATVGRPQATIRFNPAGRVLKITAAEPPPQPAAADAAGVAAIKAAAVNASPESYLFPLPEVPVAVGDEWPETFTIVAKDDGGLPIRVVLKRTYKLIEVKDGRATITFRSVTITPLKDPEVIAQLLNRETAGSIVFDVEQGLMLSRQTTVDRTVQNFAGAGRGGVMSTKSTFRERLIPAAEATARDERPAPSVGK
jgi:hypothetical protein